VKKLPDKSGRYGIYFNETLMPLPYTRNKNKAVGLRNKVAKLARLKKQIQKLESDIRMFRG
jgi:hypothetical protein